MARINAVSEAVGDSFWFCVHPLRDEDPQFVNWKNPTIRKLVLRNKDQQPDKSTDGAAFLT